MSRLSLLASVLLACGASHSTPALQVSAKSSPPSPAPAPAHADKSSVTLASLLSRPPDLVLTVRPQALARDRVYGPLLRRASEMASAYAGPTTLGTTALGALEKTDELVVAENDHGREAVIVLRGVPGSLDPTEVVDTNGKPVWRAIEGDVRTRARELAPVEPAETALFVAPGLVWIIAAGPAIGQVRAALLRPENADGLVGDETPLLALALRGETLVAQEPRLRQGALAPIGTGLLNVHLELTPGTSGLILGRLAYATPDVAIAAEVTLEEVTRAFHQRLERGAQAAAKSDGGLPSRQASTLDWLGAATVAEQGGTVSVRVPIPRRWLDTIARADLTPAAIP